MDATAAQKAADEVIKRLASGGLKVAATSSAATDSAPQPMDEVEDDDNTQEERVEQAGARPAEQDDMQDDVEEADTQAE